MRISINSAAIAVIPVTATVVILVVAVTVVGECCQSTFTFAFLVDGRSSRCFGRRRNKVLLRRVEARAFLAVTVLPFRTSCAATVTVVPATATVVVFVITVTIAEVKCGSARF